MNEIVLSTILCNALVALFCLIIAVTVIAMIQNIVHEHKVCLICYVPMGIVEHGFVTFCQLFRIFFDSEIQLRHLLHLYRDQFHVLLWLGQLHRSSRILANPSMEFFAQ